MKTKRLKNLVCAPRRILDGRRGAIARHHPFAALLLQLATCLVMLALFAAAAGCAPSEFRGAWVTAWNPGFLTPAEADETIAAAKTANMNALIIQVRKAGDAYYNSKLEPRASNISGSWDYDPLAYVIDRAHSAGLEVHAWVNALRMLSPAASAVDPRHVCSLHPEWIMSDSTGGINSPTGVYLDPGVPDVQEYTLKVITDLAANYDLDGVHLDYLRYPNREWGYNSVSVGRFNTRYGRSGAPVPDDPLWSQWRRDQLTALVGKIYQRVSSVRPGAKVTLAAVAWGDCPSDFESGSSYRAAFQDWAGWLRDGILDAAIPMNYRDETDATAAEQYRGWLEGMRRWRSDRHVYAGQMVTGDVDSAVAQLRASRDSGAPGTVCFSFNATPTRPALVAALRSAVYSQPASVPKMPWKARYAQAPDRGRYVP